jgi:hypothetical protein
VYGADVETMTALANELDQAASILGATRQRVDAKVQNSAWVGPVADRFRSTWSSGDSSRIAGASQLLSTAANVIRRNAQEQTTASSAASGSIGSTVSLSSQSLFAAGGAPWLSTVGKVTSGLDDVGKILDKVPKVYGNAWALVKTSGWSSSEAFDDAVQWGVDQGPKAISAISKFMEMPDVKFAGTALGVVGAGFAVAAAVDVWTTPSSTTWNKTESTVTAALSVGALVPGPQEPFVAIAAGAWVAGTWIYDNHAQIEQWAGNTAQAIGHAESEVAPVAQAVATAAVHQGEQVVGNLASGVTSFFSKL